jgi:hypothetical protein
MEYIDIPKHIKLNPNIDEYEKKKYKYKKEVESEDHYIVMNRRIEEWIAKNKNRKQITKLDLSYLQIEKYENLPNDVECIICNGNSAIKTLKGLPESLKKLKFNGFPLKEFDYLPSKLECLHCSSSSIEELDNLPNSLIKIKMTYYPNLHKIISLPENLKILNLHLAAELDEILCPFPSKLRKLDLFMTRIKELKVLPDTLRYLSVGMNSSLQNIPNLPPNIKFLELCSTNIKSLPLLPDSLLGLHIGSISILNNNSLPNSIRYLCSDEIQIYDKNYNVYFI